MGTLTPMSSRLSGQAGPTAECLRTGLPLSWASGDRQAEGAGRRDRHWLGL